MKKLLILLCSIFLVFGLTGFASGAMILDYVDIGNPSSEAGYNLVEWGPIQPITSGGIWGAPIPTGTGTCRVISHVVPDGNGGYVYDQYDWASIDLNFGSGGTFSIFHLEGIAIDSFDVYADSMDPSNLIFSYDASLESSSEDWFNTSIPLILTGKHTIYFNSTGTHWGSYDTYGQVAFASITVESAPVPEPATMLLLGSGLIGLAGLGRKKFFKKA